MGRRDAAMFDAMTDLAIRTTVEALPGSRIAAIADYGRDRAGLIPLWFGESDVPTPGFTRAAGTRATRDGHMPYRARRGVPALRQVLAHYMTGLYGRAVDHERIQVTASGMSAIMVALQCLIEPGRSVVSVTPVWPNANAATRILGGAVREVPLDTTQNGDRTLDLDKLFAAIDATTALLFINSPGNPTGWVLDAAPMRAILEHCRARGIWIMADEVYARITFKGEVAPSFLELAEPAARRLLRLLRCRRRARFRGPAAPADRQGGGGPGPGGGVRPRRRGLHPLMLRQRHRHHRYGARPPGPRALVTPGAADGPSS